MDYLIGIDAGGTKTVACGFDLDGNPLETAKAGAGNLTASFDTAVSNIKAAAEEIMKRHQNDCCKLLYIGAAGAETGSVKENAAKELSLCFGEKAESVKVTNDAKLALYSALKGEDGILVISGTGSIAYMKSGKSFSRFGGWGHLINDDGSGYSIGIKAIRYITYSFDTGEPETPLKRAVFEALSITELKELIDFTYRANKSEIAALVPVIEGLAASGDAQAVEILSWAGKRLSFLAVGLCRRYHIEKPKIAISGSVIKKTLAIKLAFINALDENLSDYLLTDEDFEPTKAVYYIWRDSSVLQ